MTTGGALEGFEPDNTAEVSTETAPEVTEPQADGEVDWQAKYEAEVVARTKSDNDLKSQRNGKQSADDRQQVVVDALQRLEIRQERSELQNDALMNALASGETAGLPEQVAEINQKSQQQQASQRQIDASNQLYNQIIDTVVPLAGGDRDAAKTMIETQPEFKDVRDGWATHSQDTIDLVGLSGVVAQTAQVAMSMTGQQKVDAVRQAQETAAQKLEDADVLDLDTGGSAAPADVSDTARNIRLADPAYSWTDDDKKWYPEYRKKLGLRNRS